MHQVQLPDQVYERAKARAAEAGYQNVDEYIVDVLEDDGDVEEDLSHRFTPKVITHLESIMDAIDAGAPTYTLDEVNQYIDQLRAERVQNKPA